MMKEFLNQVETGPNHTMKAPNMNMLCNLYDVKSDQSFSKMLFRCNTSVLDSLLQTFYCKR